jgi:hypothetical protein
MVIFLLAIPSPKMRELHLSVYEEKREMRGESAIFPTLYLDLFSSQNEREVERK